MIRQVSDREREQLSALLDGRLSTAEKAALEQKITASPELAEEWGQLQRLHAMMKELPRHRVRRSFTLRAGTVPERRPSPFLLPMRWVSGLASIALVILLAADYFPLLQHNGMIAPAPAAPASASESVQADRSAQGQFPSQIITWSTPTPRAFGKGGGPGESLKQSVPLQQDNAGANMAAPAPAPMLEAPAEAQPAATSAPLESSGEKPSAEGPILGIRPTEEQGKILETETPSEAAANAPERSLHPAAEIILLILAVGSAATAILLKKRK